MEKLCYRGVSYKRSPIELRYLLNFRSRLERLEREEDRNKPSTHFEEQAAA